MKKNTSETREKTGYEKFADKYLTTSAVTLIGFTALLVVGLLMSAFPANSPLSLESQMGNPSKPRVFVTNDETYYEQWKFYAEIMPMEYLTSTTAIFHPGQFPGVSLETAAGYIPDTAYYIMFGCQRGGVDYVSVRIDSVEHMTPQIIGMCAEGYEGPWRIEYKVRK